MNEDGASRHALQELLAHIRNESARECAEIRTRTEQEVRSLLRDAQRQARARVTRALAAERAASEARCIRENGISAMRVRRQHQQLERQALDRGWALLCNELTRRWQDPAARRAWVDGALTTAQRRLVARSWRVHHPELLDVAARRQAAAAVQALDAAIAIEWVADAALTEGVRIEAEGACVDATSCGLLAQRGQVEGLLLAAIEAASRRPPERNP